MFPRLLVIPLRLIDDAETFKQVPGREQITKPLHDFERLPVVLESLRIIGFPMKNGPEGRIGGTLSRAAPNPPGNHHAFPQHRVGLVQLALLNRCPGVPEKVPELLVLLERSLRKKREGKREDQGNRSDPVSQES